MRGTVTMRRVLPFAFACLVEMAGAAVAADQPISGAKLLLIQSGGAAKLVFVSKDPAFLFPAIGGADDPGTGAPGGLQVDLLSPVEPLGVSLTAPAGVGTPGWTSAPGAVPSHRFRNGAAPDAFSTMKLVVMKQGRVLKVIARSTGLALTGPQGSVGIRIVTGSLRNCARFDTTTVRRDEAGRFVARAASAAGLSDCSNTALGGAEPACGDGIRNQSSEECDGSDTGYCPVCRPAGFPGACECCTHGGPDTQIIGCCNPSSIIIPGPDSSGTCHSTRCDAPWGCSVSDVCQTDGTCCAPVGGVCRLTVLGGLSLGPCCAGLDCHTLDGFGNIACCVPGGGSCTGDGECCTTHCTPGGTCEPCRTGGAACGSPFECCSLSCSAGICDACGAAGAGCFDDASCCGGTCDVATSTCD